VQGVWKSSEPASSSSGAPVFGASLLRPRRGGGWSIFSRTAGEIQFVVGARTDVFAVFDLNVVNLDQIAGIFVLCVMRCL